MYSHRPVYGWLDLLTSMWPLFATVDAYSASGDRVQAASPCSLVPSVTCGPRTTDHGSLCAHNSWSYSLAMQCAPHECLEHQEFCTLYIIHSRQGILQILILKFISAVFISSRFCSIGGLIRHLCNTWPTSSVNSFQWITMASESFH